jgi:chromosome segregation ATPase
MDVVDKYLLLLTRLVEEEQVLAAALRVKEAAILMVETLISEDSSKDISTDKASAKEVSKSKKVLGADVPRELKVLLHFFNKEDDKISYSKELFNNTDPVDAGGKLFLKLVNDMKDETLKYLKENINVQHRYTFEQIETHLKYFYVNYLLCYFLLKNVNVSTGLDITDAEIEVFFATNQTEAPEIKDTVEKVTRHVIGVSKEPYVPPKGLSNNAEKRILEGTLRQVTAIIEQKKQDIVTKPIKPAEEIIEDVLAENNLAYIELDKTREELAKTTSARDDLEKIIKDQSEIDSVTRQQILEDSEKFTENLRIILGIAKELNNDEIFYHEVLKRIDEIPVIPEIEDNGNELIQTRNSLLKKQQIQLNMICEHIKEIVDAYSRFRTTIRKRVAANTRLQGELEQLAALIDNYTADKQTQATEIMELQSEIRMLEQTNTEIQKIMDATIDQQKSSLVIQVEANKELTNEYNRIKRRDQYMEEQIKQLSERVIELEKSDGQNEEIVKSNYLIAALKRELENNNEILSRLKVEGTSNSGDKVRFDYEVTIKNLLELLHEKEELLSEKERKIYNLTTDIEAGIHISSELEQLKKESREKIERIVYESLKEIEKINNDLTAEKKENEKKINEIIADAQIKIDAARAEVNATKEEAGTKITELQTKLDNYKLEKDELQAQIDKAKESEKTIAVLTKNIEEAETKINDLQAKSEEAETKINELEAKSEEAETKINDLQAKTEEAETKSEEAGTKITELQTQLDNYKREKDELQAQIDKAKDLDEKLLILTKNIESAEKEKSELQAQLEETKEGAEKEKSELQAQLEETKEGAEKEKGEMKDKIKNMQFMNLVYLIKLRKLNQIILDNRAKLSFQSSKEKQSQLSDEELKQLLTEIQNAEDNKLLLEENPFNHIADSIYQNSELIINTQEHAMHNADVFIETLEKATSKIKELEEQMGTNSNDLDGVKSAFVKLQNAYEEKKTEITSIQSQLFQSSQNMDVYKRTANDIIRALRDESDKRVKEIKDAVHERIRELVEKQDEQKSEFNDQTNSKIKELTAKAESNIAAAKEQAAANVAEAKKQAAEEIEQAAKNVAEAKEKAAKNVAEAKSAAEEVELRSAKEVAEAKDEVARKEKELSDEKSKLIESQRMVEELKNEKTGMFKRVASSVSKAISDIKGITAKAESNIAEARGKAAANVAAAKKQAEKDVAEAKEAAKEVETRTAQEVARTAKELSEEKSKLTALEIKIEKLQEKANTDIEQTKEKYKHDEEVLKSEIDTLGRRLELKEQQAKKIFEEKTILESKIKTTLVKAQEATDQAIKATENATSLYITAKQEQVGLREKIANYNKREREYSNKKVLQDNIIVELRKEIDTLKEKVKSTNEEQISSLMAKISELTHECDVLYEKRTVDEDQYRRELLANQRVAEGAAQIDDLTRQIGENKETARINELENIKSKLQRYLDTPEGITRESLNSIFNELQGK